MGRAKWQERERRPGSALKVKRDSERRPRDCREALSSSRGSLTHAWISVVYHGSRRGFQRERKRPVNFRRAPIAERTLLAFPYHHSQTTSPSSRSTSSHRQDSRAVKRVSAPAGLGQRRSDSELTVTPILDSSSPAPASALRTVRMAFRLLSLSRKSSRTRELSLGCGCPAKGRRRISCQFGFNFLSATGAKASIAALLTGIGLAGKGTQRSASHRRLGHPEH